MHVHEPPEVAGDPLTARERAALRQLLRVERLLIGGLDRALAPAGLSWQDHAVLSVLAGRAGRRAPTGELATALGWEKSRLSHHLDRMARRGLVRRDQSHDDLRHWFVELTHAGGTALGDAAAAHAAAVRDLLTHRLGDDQLDALTAITAALLDR